MENQILEKSKTGENLVNELNTIEELLSVARTYKLEGECVYWALQYMKEHPEFSPIEAMSYAMAEWVK